MKRRKRWRNRAVNAWCREAELEMRWPWQWWEKAVVGGETYDCWIGPSGWYIASWSLYRLSPQSCCPAAQSPGHWAMTGCPIWRTFHFLDWTSSENLYDLCNALGSHAWIWGNCSRPCHSLMLLWMSLISVVIGSHLNVQRTLYWQRPGRCLYHRRLGLAHVKWHDYVVSLVGGSVLLCRCPWREAYWGWRFTKTLSAQALPSQEMSLLMVALNNGVSSWLPLDQNIKHSSLG